MRSLGWMGLLAVAVACSGKDDTATGSASDGALCMPTELSNPDCESGQAVLRVNVTVAGAPAPTGTTVYATDCDGAENTAVTDELGDARFSLPAATYVVRAENPGEGLSSTTDTLDVPGCQTTSADLTM